PPVEANHVLTVGWRITQILTPDEDNAGVQTDLHPLWLVDQLEHLLEVFQAVSQARSLPRRGFQEDTHLLLRTAAMDSIDSPRKLGEARLLSRTGMGSRVGDQVRNPQRLASIQLHQ